MIHQEKIENEIIPKIEEKKIDLPIVICSYFSQELPSKTGIDIITTKTGDRFRPRSPKLGTKSCDWFIDTKKNITKIM